PDDADPSPLRDEGVVGDEDHGALLDHGGDPLRGRLRALLPVLHRLRPVTVLVVGAPELVAQALQRAREEDDVIVVDQSPRRLEEVEATARDPRVWYLIGDADVLPLPDGFVDEVLGDAAAA